VKKLKEPPKDADVGDDHNDHETADPSTQITGVEVH
jgi:hypothetical protein